MLRRLMVVIVGGVVCYLLPPLVLVALFLIPVSRERPGLVLAMSQIAPDSTAAWPDGLNQGRERVLAVWRAGKRPGGAGTT